MKKQSQRRISFIVVLIFIITWKTAAQETVLRKNEISPNRNTYNGFMPGGLVASATINYQVSSAFKQKPLLPIAFVSRNVLPADFYLQHVGYFCKKEWELEKSVHIPLRFRLGSLEYCNYLEGKK